MKRFTCLVSAVILLCAATASLAGPPVFKQKKYYGPIPANMLSFSMGFIDGPTAEHLIDHFENWANERNGQDIWTDFSNSPFFLAGYQYQLTPNHFFRSSVSFSYLSTESIGDYVAQGDSLFQLQIDRTLKIYLLSLELGFIYYVMEPEVRNFSPYVGGGFSTVFPFVRLDNESFFEGNSFDNPGETRSKNSYQAGMHVEFGMIYYITNKYSAAMEGRLQMAQSKFKMHNGNFDLDYQGFSLGLNLNYHF